VTRRISAEFAGTSRFEILRCIGAGGMGTVYEASDKERNARVALKTLRAMNAESLLRFKKEFRDFQDLSHPNLVSVGELFADEGEWFFTMELVDGVNFLEYVRPGTFVERGQSFSPVPGVPFDEHAPTAESLPQMISSPRGFTGRQSSGALLNEARLRTALRQLALGLHALHEANKVHRDIKPSNVLVTQHGRVVLLDFGLAADLEGREHKSEVDIVGTVEYMAPEQAAARQVGPAADWYAVGVVLYEALTGQVPLSGPPIEVLMNKQRLDAPSPRAINPAAPEDLSRLAAELMRFNPATRPSGKQVLERLGAASPSGPSAHSLSSFSSSMQFVGRAQELAHLMGAFERSQKQALAVSVHGESGLGKSALVRHFVDRLKSREPSTVALTGTCYERESVPFKAVDGLIDALSQYMRRLPKAEAAALLPRRASLLAQVFPVLQRVEAVAEAPRPTEDVLDPQELRSRLFLALRELLERLTDRHPVVLVIDDLQWADADSLALLAEVLRPPEAPPILLVATVRSTDETSSANRLERIDSQLHHRVEHVPLQRMSAEEARELAEALVRRAQTQAGLNAAQIAQEAGGHPLFIDELIRHACAIGTAAAPSLQLEEALWARITQLDNDAQRVLELVALASGRILQHTAAQAAEMSFAELAKHVGVLRVAHLLRTTGMRASDTVEPYHDRVRRAVLMHLSPASIRTHHRRLAVALETSGQLDPEALTVHWREAAEPVKAGHFARLAAEKAERALAFDRAARFYQQCLDLGASGGGQAQELRVRLAHALANAGRGQEAGVAYLQAAAEARPADALDLRRRGAEQLLRAGHLDEGIRALQSVLDEVKLSMAPTPMRALTSLLFKRAQVRLRGYRFTERHESQITAEQLTRIDTCWAAAAGLSTFDTIRAAEFQAHHLILALRAGEPYRVARALAMEAGLAATGGQGGVTRAEQLLQISGGLADRLSHPHAQGLTKLASGVTAFQHGDWREAQRRMDEAQATFRDKCSGVAWEMTTAELFRLSSLTMMGEIPALRQTVPAVIQAAESRGDLYATTNVRVRHMLFQLLADDNVDRAQREVEEAMRKWSPPGYMSQHYYYLAALASIDLYRGDAKRAWERICESWPQLERSLFLRVQFIRIDALCLRARCALAAAPPGPQGSALRRKAAGDAARIGKERVSWAAGLAGMLDACRLAGDGDTDAGKKRLLEAARKLQAADMNLYAHCALRRAGEADESDRWMEQQEIRNPAKMAAVLIPFPA
jgi:serine/threonine protein kinase